MGRTIGIVGSRYGMNVAQGEALKELLVRLKPEIVVHGDRIGVAIQAHFIALALGISVEVYPPDPPSTRAFAKDCVVHPYRSPDLSLLDVVDASDALLLLPCVDRIEKRETWKAEAFAKRLGVPVIVIFPDGTVEKR